MLSTLSVLPPDPILGLAATCRADTNPDKIDLTVGIYMDENGICPVFEAVQIAQRALVADAKYEQAAKLARAVLTFQELLHLSSQSR